MRSILPDRSRAIAFRMGLCFLIIGLCPHAIDAQERETMLLVDQLISLLATGDDAMASAERMVHSKGEWLGDGFNLHPNGTPVSQSGPFDSETNRHHDNLQKA